MVNKRGNPNMVKGGPPVNPRGPTAKGLRSRREAQQQLSDALKSDDPDAIHGLVVALVRKVNEGDAKMIQFAWEFLWGKPQAHVEVTSADSQVPMDQLVAAARHALREYDAKELLKLGDGSDEDH